MPSPPGTGASHTYSACVWPVKMASTAGSVSFTISAKAPPSATACASVAVEPLSSVPSWYWATITSTWSSISVTTRLTSATGSRNSMPLMPSFDTSVGVCCVTAPITPTRTPSTSKIA